MGEQEELLPIIIKLSPEIFDAQNQDLRTENKNVIKHADWLPYHSLEA